MVLISFPYYVVGVTEVYAFIYCGSLLAYHKVMTPVKKRSRHVAVFKRSTYFPTVFHTSKKKVEEA